MHEIAMVEDMFRIILKVADDNHINRIDRVNIVIGEYLQIKPSLFEFAFESAKEGTIASGAELNLFTRQVRLKCKQCTQSFLLSDLKYSCPDCGGGELDIVDGKDIYIKSIEGE